MIVRVTGRTIKVYFDNTLVDTTILYSVKVSVRRASTNYNAEANIAIKVVEFNDLGYDVGTEVEIKRTIDGSDVTIFYGYINEFTEQQNSGVYTIKCKDPLYYLQLSYITTSFDYEIDSEAGVVSEMAKTIIQDSGLVAEVVDSSEYPILERYVIDQKTRFNVLQAFADYLLWQLYFNPVTKAVVLAPYGYEEYSSPLIVGDDVVNIPKWKLSLARMRNVITINGASEFQNREESFAPSGTTYTLEYVPGSTEVRLDGVLKTRGIPDSTSPYDYYVKAESKQIIFSSTPTGTALVVQYQAKIPIPVTGKHYESLESYPEQEEKFDMKDVITIADAQTRLNYLLKYLGMPVRGTIINVVNAADITLKHLVNVVDDFSAKDFWMPIQKIDYLYPEPYDTLEVGDLPFDLNDIMNNINKRLRMLENSETKNVEILSQILGSECMLEQDIRGDLRVLTPTGNYYDEGLLYDAGNVYDNQVETGGDISITSGLVGFWKLDNNGTDSSSNHLDGTVTGAASATGVDGVAAHALDFDTTDKVSVPNNALFYGNTVTISAWVKPTAAGASQFIAGRWGDAHVKRKFLLYRAGNDVYFYTMGALVSEYISAVGILSVGSWTHITGTYDGTTARIYANGIQVSSGTKPTQADNTEPFVIGNYGPAGSGPFNGVIDSVGWWNRALNNSEVAKVATTLYPVGASTVAKHIAENKLHWCTDVSTTLYDGISLATISSANRTISFTDGQYYQTTELFRGFTPRFYKLIIPNGVVTGTLTYQISGDGGVTYQTVIKNKKEYFAVANTAGILLKITSTGVSTISFNDANKVPQTISLEVYE